MGRRNKDSNLAPCFEGSSLMPEKKPTEMSRSNFRLLKLILYTLFDVSPAGAFLENTPAFVKGLPAPTDSKKQLTDHQQNHTDRHFEASGLKSAHGVKKRNSILGSTQHGGGRLLKVFRRMSTKSKRDMLETEHLTSSDRDIYGSSDSLFEIQVEGSLGTYSDYHDGKVKRDPHFKEHPHESEFEVLKRRLEQHEEEVQKLRDELSSLRSSSGSSQAESPRSHSATSGSEKCESFSFDRAVSPSPSHSSTSDPFDGESQILFEFEEGQLVKLVREEQTRWRICKAQVTDGDVSFANVERDVPLVRRSSNSLYNQRDRTLDTFLSDVAALNKHGTLEKYPQKGVGFVYQGIGSQPDGPPRMILGDQYTKEKELFLEVVPSICEGNCLDEDTSPSEHARATKQDPSLETRSFRFVSESTNRSKTQHDECPFRPAEENHFVGVGSDERVESGRLQELEDSERLFQEIKAHSRKMSIMDLPVHDHHDHDNAEFAEIDRPSRLNELRERGEKFMKILLSPRRDNSYGTTSSISGTSSPSSTIASTSPRGSFTMKEDENTVQADIPENGCCNPSVESTLAPVCESGMQESGVTKSSINDQIQNIDLSSPRDILASKFGSLVRTRSLDLPRHIWEDVQAEISDEAVDTTPVVAGEVHFHPRFSRDLSISVLTGYKQQRERTARGREISPAVAIDPGFRITEDKSAGKKLEEHANVPVPVLCGPSGVPSTGSDCANANEVRRLSWTASGSRALTRFGEEAAKQKSLSQAVSPDKLNCRPRYNRTRSCLPSEPGVNMNE